MNFMGLISRSIAVLAGIWLLVSGSNDLSMRSAGNKGYGETSFAALNIRSRGSLKVGLGLMALSASAFGVEIKGLSNDNSIESNEDNV